MKKYWLIIVMILLLPLKVHGVSKSFSQELLYYRWDRISYTSSDASSIYIYAKSYEYDGEKYTLTGDTKTDNIDWISRMFGSWIDQEVVYTCKSNTEMSCNELYVVFPSIQTIINRDRLTFRLINGEELNDIRYLKIADQFTYQNSKYVLKDITNYDLSEVLNNSGAAEHKYTCLTNETSCDTLYYIEYSGGYGILLTDSTYDFVLANSYQYKDGNIILEDIVESQWPNYTNYEGYYTCLTKDIICKDKVYLTEAYIPTTIFYSYEVIESWGDNEWKFKEMQAPSQNIQGKVGEKIDVSDFTIKEDEVTIIDKRIIEIKDDKLVMKEEGETDIVKKESPEVVLYHVVVKNSSIVNPNTKSYFIIASAIIGIIIISSTTFYILLKKKNS